MTERRKNLLMLATLLGIMMVFFGHILFTNKIIRAPDIINEYYWTVLNVTKMPLSDIFHIKLTADWDIFNNSGNTLEGGGLGNQFLVWQKLLYHIVPPPASVAWFIVIHFFIGAAGVYAYCRAIGISCVAALLGAMVFALAPEMVSLINAGHVLKIATISIAPWAFFLIERGFLTRRVIWFMATGFILAVQFFYTHWQIAYYTCLCIGVYGICRYIGLVAQEKEKRTTVRLLVLNVVVLCFFLSSVAIDLLPLANWSTATNRGAQSGANQGKGGLEREEAMSWSLPPEEVAAFVIPGMFGFSRQEGGENPPNITTYYWGRMVFTQTISYFGLLPLLLLPLPLIFRRDRYTWLAVAGIVGCLLFSMGKYTPFYNWLFDHFPGVNRFRVPKMIMFIPVICFGVVAARGLDLVMDETVRASRAFRRYLWGLALLPVALIVLLGIEYAGRDYLVNRFFEMFARPTRYEQGPELIQQRWQNLMTETAIAAGVAAACAAILIAGTRRISLARWMPVLLLGVFLFDVGRVNSKFMFLVDVPKETRKDYNTAVMDFLAQQPKEYRVLPLAGSPGPYSSKHIPVMFIPMPVQQTRWQEYLDNFNLGSSMPDILNLKYLVLTADQYTQERTQLGAKYAPIFTAPDNSEVVLENRAVLPKGWLVPSVMLETNPVRRLAILQSPQFNPVKVALVESSPPIPLADPSSAPSPFPSQNVSIPVYKGEQIVVEATAPRNALLVLGEKYYKGWKATIDGRSAEIVPVDHILRGVYLTPGQHRVEFRFDPLPFKIGKFLTLGSFVLFAAMLVREWLLQRRRVKSEW